MTKWNLNEKPNSRPRTDLLFSGFFPQLRISWSQTKGQTHPAISYTHPSLPAQTPYLGSWTLNCSCCKGFYSFFYDFSSAFCSVFFTSSSVLKILLFPKSHWTAAAINLLLQNPSPDHPSWAFRALYLVSFDLMDLITLISLIMRNTTPKKVTDTNYRVLSFNPLVQQHRWAHFNPM